MKKFTVIKISTLVLAGYLIVCGYKEGPAKNSGWQCTGAETDQSNPTGCSTGGGCHATTATAGITVTLELDSVGVPITHYIGGNTYTVKLTGTNTTSSNLPAFGFQLSAIIGSTPYATPVATDMAGTWATSLPTNVHYAAPSKYYLIGCVEQSTQLPPTTGTGGTGTTYVESINWTAPTAGSGTISFWAALNAVNNNGNADAGDLWNVKHIIINEIVTGIADVSDNHAVRVFPNPFSQTATFTFANEINKGVVTLYDLMGNKIKQVDFSGTQIMIDKDNIPAGIYFYCVTSEEQPIATGKLMVQ
jgi:hypothetical protein